MDRQSYGQYTYNTYTYYPIDRTLPTLEYVYRRETPTVVFRHKTSNFWIQVRPTYDRSARWMLANEINLGNITILYWKK